MNKLLALGTLANFASHQLALSWAKKNLPKEKYEEIHKSYNATFKWTVLFIVVVCMPIMIAFMSLVFKAPFSTKEDENLPKGATSYISARVDYDGNFFWTHDSKKYEYALKDYGLSPDGYRFGDKVKVFIDEEQNVIEVITIEEGPTTKEKEVLIGTIGAIVVPVILIICVYVPIAYSTFAKPWREFYREFDEN